MSFSQSPQPTSFLKSTLQPNPTLWLTHILLLVFVACFAMSTSAAAQVLSQGKGNLRVMTYNVDEGTDYIELLQAGNLTGVTNAMAFTIFQVRSTNPPARADAIAAQIAAASPHLVGLQEVTQWRTGSGQQGLEALFTQNPALLTLEFDFLQLIQDALARRGQHYRLVLVANQFDLPVLPTSSGEFVKATNRIAMLARTDLDPADFQVGNVQTGTYAAELVINPPFQLPPFIPVPIHAPRAWIAADVTFQGAQDRFFTTHLESVSPLLRRAQAGQLRAIAGTTAQPVIIAMDSNAQAGPPPIEDTYRDFLNAGYTDAWTTTHPSDPGFTFGQAQFLNNSVSLLFQRIDLILLHGAVAAQGADVLGDNLADRTAGGLWPSDHAAVAARLKVGEAE